MYDDYSNDHQGGVSTAIEITASMMDQFLTTFDIEEWSELLGYVDLDEELDKKASVELKEIERIVKDSERLTDNAEIQTLIKSLARLPTSTNIRIGRYHMNIMISMVSSFKKVLTSIKEKK